MSLDKQIENSAVLPDANLKPEHTDGSSSSAGRRRHGGCFFKVFSIVCVALIGVSAFLYYAHRSTQIEPEFYVSALEMDVETYQKAGKDFEANLLQLNTDVRHQKEWQVEFTAEQINGWLAIDLPEKFPGTLPKEVSEPRVAFANDEIQLAFRFVSPHWSGIITATGTVFCTQEKNQIGIQIRDLRSGLIPLPISKWGERISSACRNSGVALSWSQKDGQVVAVVDLPEKFLDIKSRKITLNSIVIEEDLLSLNGTSETLPSDRDSVSNLPRENPSPPQAR